LFSQVRRVTTVGFVLPPIDKSRELDYEQGVLDDREDSWPSLAPPRRSRDVFRHRIGRSGDPGIHWDWTVFEVMEGPNLLDTVVKPLRPAVVALSVLATLSCSHGRAPSPVNSAIEVRHDAIRLPGMRQIQELTFPKGVRPYNVVTDGQSVAWTSGGKGTDTTGKFLDLMVNQRGPARRIAVAEPGQSLGAVVINGAAVYWRVITRVDADCGDPDKACATWTVRYRDSQGNVSDVARSAAPARSAVWPQLWSAGGHGVLVQLPEDGDPEHTRYCLAVKNNLNCLVRGVAPSSFPPDQIGVIAHRGVTLVRVPFADPHHPVVLVRGVGPYFQPKEALYGDRRAHEDNAPSQTRVTITVGTHGVGKFASDSGLFAMFWPSDNQFVSLRFEGLYIFDVATRQSTRVTMPDALLPGGNLHALYGRGFSFVRQVDGAAQLISYIDSRTG
jgi:hypothetical protein